MADESPRRLPRWWVRALRTLGLALSTVLILLIGLAMFFSDRLIFFPSREGDWNARERQEFPIEEVAFTASDGARLVSWYLRVPKPRCTILFFHGNAGNLSDRVDMLVALGRLEADVLIVGYHGYGRSEGSPSESALHLDAEAAWGYLTETRGVPASRIVLLGESLGGAPAVELASKRPCGGVILQSAFASIREMASQVMPLFPAHWFMKSKFDNLARIPSVAAPKLFIATRRDEVVPFDQTRRLYEASPEPKTWVEFDDCGHNDLFWRHRTDWSAAIRQFLDRLPDQR